MIKEANNPGNKFKVTGNSTMRKGLNSFQSEIKKHQERCHLMLLWRFNSYPRKPSLHCSATFSTISVEHIFVTRES